MELLIVIGLFLILLRIIGAFTNDEKSKETTSSISYKKKAKHKKEIASKDDSFGREHETNTSKKSDSTYTEPVKHVSKTEHERTSKHTRKRVDSGPPPIDEGYFNSLMSDGDSTLESHSSQISTNIDIKPDWESIRDILRRNRISCLYHFTDKRNIDSIRSNGGLYSWQWLEENRVYIPAQGGNDLSRRLDSQKGYANFVRLCFIRRHPMLYKAKHDGRISDHVLLEIDIEVLSYSSTLFSNINATARGANIGSSLGDLNKIRFDLINHGYWSNDEEKRYIQAEVLVQKFVPIQYIKNI